MAKKKKKQTPKDDLIESLMNDVQELDGQDTQLQKDAHVLYLDDESQDAQRQEGEGHEEFLVGLHGEENRVDEPVPEVVNLWQDIKEPDSSESDEKTMNLQAEQEPLVPPEDVDGDRTVAVEGFANRQPQYQSPVTPKISFGTLREPLVAATAGGSVYASNDATLAQAESLKLAQQRILKLEKELEKYRQENEEISSAGEIIRNRSEELTARIFTLEKEKKEIVETLQNELIIIKGTLQYKESEINKARLKIEELETRLKSDFKKIRVRERELENRLELVKAEKTALLRAKDENILELKRKIDHLQGEMDNYRSKVLDLNKTLDSNQEQFKRTVRALRLALSNLEVKEESIVPLKKAD